MWTFYPVPQLLGCKMQPIIGHEYSFQRFTLKDKLFCVNEDVKESNATKKPMKK